MLKLKVISKNDKELACSIASQTPSLVYSAKYNEGDYILLTTDELNAFYIVQFEDSMPEAIIFAPENNIKFVIPKEGNRQNYSPKSFTGDCHVIKARKATKEEVAQRRNLALNVYDEHENTSFYPHASANVETRGEAVFAARNAVDGNFQNDSHGCYPYQSWGINRDPNAALTIDFGRPVLVDEIRLTLRADFPHDNYWTSAKVTFSDSTTETLPLEMLAAPQCFKISQRKVTSLVLDTLIMAEGISPFPALTQIEVFGTEVL